VQVVRLAAVIENKILGKLNKPRFCNGWADVLIMYGQIYILDHVIM